MKGESEGEKTKEELLEEGERACLLKLSLLDQLLILRVEITSEF